MTRLSDVEIKSLGDGWFGFDETAHTWGMAARWTPAGWEMARRAFVETPAAAWEVAFVLAAHDLVEVARRGALDSGDGRAP